MANDFPEHRFMHTIFNGESYIHSNAQTTNQDQDRAPAHSLVLLSLSSDGCYHSATMRQKTIEIEIRLYRSQWLATLMHPIEAK